MPFLFNKLNRLNKQYYLNLWHLNTNRRLIQTSSYLLRKSHYDVLGVKINATQNEIKKAYFERSKKFHPDRNLSLKDAEKKRNQKMFLNVQKAYELLSNQDLKDEYDRKMFGRVSTYQRKTPEKDIYESQSNFYEIKKKSPTMPKRTREERHQLVARTLITTSFERRATEESYVIHNLKRAQSRKEDENVHFVAFIFMILIILIILL